MGFLQNGFCDPGAWKCGGQRDRAAPWRRDRHEKLCGDSGTCGACPDQSCSPAQGAVPCILYKLAAAVTEPVSDKRISGCLKGLANGGMLYVKLLGYSVLLFL